MLMMLFYCRNFYFILKRQKPDIKEQKEHQEYPNSETTAHHV